jgi:RND family efflux transporter MFP subunit
MMMSYMLKICTTALCSLTLLTASLAPGMAETGGKEATAPVLVRVAKASEQEVPVLIEVAGTLQAAQRAAIAAKVTGVITRMPVALGSTVKAGDLLVLISAEEIGARLSQAEAQLAQAKRNLDRDQNLLAKNAATPDAVKSSNEQYAIAQAGYREAKTMMGYAAVTAPFDGVITRKNVNSGDLATPGTVLLQVENNRSLQVNTAVPESLVLSLHTGDVLTVNIPAADTVVQGTITEIAPAADPNSRTAPVVIDLPANPNLRSGQFARVLLPGKGSQSLQIPTSAVVPSGQMDRVFVVEGDRARLRLVRTGPSLDGTTEILSGLSAGETVIIANNRLLTDGQTVRTAP